MTFRETTLVLFSADLAGFARATAPLEPLAIAAFLDDWYRQCAEVVARHGGRIIKLMGDGCFAVFSEARCAGAVDAAVELAGAIGGLAATHRLAVEVGTKIHLGVVAEGEAGPDADRRYDVFGAAVNDLFRMRGAGMLVISEPVYLRLPDDRRAAWQPHASPSTYSLARP